MSQNLQHSIEFGNNATVFRHRVLRNTYWLLALSMIPTVLGAWLGVQMHFSFFPGRPGLSMIAFMAVAFGFMYAIEKTKETATGVAVLLGFTFFMGLMLSSQPHHAHDRAWVGIGMGTWDYDGRPSYVRLDRVLDVPEESIRREGAILDRPTFEVVAMRLRSDYSWS